MASARIDILGIEMDWNPIDTAPRDGTEVILTDGFKRSVAYWGTPDTGCQPMWIIATYADGDYNAWLEFESPTDWYPCPPLPSRRCPRT